MSTVFVKLGGSLITNKRTEESPRLEVIQRLAAEIAQARLMKPNLRLVIGHGSGSYGHVFGRRYGTRTGVYTTEQWFGFAKTADAAQRLNRIVVDALLAANVPAWSVQPSVALRSHNGAITAGPEETVAAALAKGLVPVVHGDVALDDYLGGTIASTEEIFEWLMPFFEVERIILAGEVDGIYTADPLEDKAAVRIEEIQPHLLDEIVSGLSGSHGVDVTGGMLTKVNQAVRMVEKNPMLEVVVCSGLVPGNLTRLLCDETDVQGTRIHI